MNFSMIFAAASAGVYDPYTTSRFSGHSLIATANIIHGIVRIVGYPLLAKVADVRASSELPLQTSADPDFVEYRSTARLRRSSTVSRPRQCPLRRL